MPDEDNRTLLCGSIHNKAVRTTGTRLLLHYVAWTNVLQPHAALTRSSYARSSGLGLLSPKAALACVPALTAHHHHLYPPVRP